MTTTTRRDPASADSTAHEDGADAGGVVDARAQVGEGEAPGSRVQAGGQGAASGQAGGQAPVGGVRAPQQDRSRATRARILQSTVECLATRGWQATTTSVVAEHSGVSRGALQHHFPTREGLLLTALEHMFEDRVTRYFAPQEGEGFESDAEDRVAPAAEAGGGVSEEAGGDPEGLPGGDRFEQLVEQVLDYYTSDLFKAALQIWTAAAAEPSLRERILPLEQKFAKDVYDMAVRTLRADVSDERTHRLIQTTLDLARGLGLADVLSDDSARRRKIARFWAEELRSIRRTDGSSPG
ncbi:MULTISPECIES: TetR/AcrR family transcriptional regulator [Brevibacterium]|uniref:HTH tetR-type domain-containing protein n=1 Tax=Brevibacterium salitolerans TaxID=1403566 RepID=A0ABN2WZ15_9MICO|nr:TetR/AcrR family transcriptional regulator [Brevibacterium sp.]